MTLSAPRYANWWSRIILAGQFDRQFIVPCAPRPAVRLGMQWLESRVLRPRLDDIELRQPVFVVGLHRSGTTMLQDVICSLPGVAYINNVMNVYPDSPCAADWVRKRFELDISGERYLGDGVPVSGGTPNEGVSFWRRWLDENPYDYSYIEQSADRFSPERRQQIFDDIRRVLWCFRPARSRFFCKNPCLTPHVTLLAELFPDAKILHVVRDPRDCVPSMIKFYQRNCEQLERIRRSGGHGVYDVEPFMPYARLPRLREYVEEYGADSVEAVARLWRDGVDWIHDRRKQLNSFMEVRYESVIADPETELKRILEFCEFDWDAAIPELQRQVRAIRPVRRRIDDDQTARITEICAESMQRLGYGELTDPATDFLSDGRRNKLLNTG